MQHCPPHILRVLQHAFDFCAWEKFELDSLQRQVLLTVCENEGSKEKIIAALFKGVEPGSARDLALWEALVDLEMASLIVPDEIKILKSYPRIPIASNLPNYFFHPRLLMELKGESLAVEFGTVKKGLTKKVIIDISQNKFRPSDQNQNSEVPDFIGKHVFDLDIKEGVSHTIKGYIRADGSLRIVIAADQ